MSGSPVAGSIKYAWFTATAHHSLHSRPQPLHAHSTHHYLYLPPSICLPSRPFQHFLTSTLTNLHRTLASLQTPTLPSTHAHNLYPHAYTILQPPFQPPSTPGY
ncbi:hypothetical protein E2C01_094280 [Portunus trituberculatus]|uniref:Uncharacterized protein n=1 Tax=Portunus trituberculatus TaxID=210409 RepID=A0A5B7K2P2_PORTR|nr:hypothetical protein [Portunus trituberculatus]